MFTKPGFVAQPFTRRQILLGACATVAAIVVPTSRPGVTAYQSDLASMGFPVLDVTVVADALTGVPDALDAGRYLVNVTVDANLSGVSFVQPVGIAAADLAAMLGAGASAGPATAEASRAGATNAGSAGSPTGLYESLFAGGIYGTPGEVASVVLDLSPGEWIALGETSNGASIAAIFEVGGEVPADAAEPEADVVVTLGNFEILIEGTLTSGEHTVRIEHQGAEPHFLDLAAVPDGTTNDDLGAMFDSAVTEMAASPPPLLLGVGFTPVVHTATQSHQTVTWQVITLEAGTYAAMCWFPGADTGEPHVFHGMHTVFSVDD